VAEDIAFNNVILQYSDLAVSEYKTTESEALPQGDYYWRIRAIDGAGNASDWSSAVQFTAGFMSTSTLIIILVVLIVVLVILLRIRAVFSKK
jgi:predicted phage tail protein